MAGWNSQRGPLFHVKQCKMARPAMRYQRTRASDRFDLRRVYWLPSRLQQSACENSSTTTPCRGCSFAVLVAAVVVPVQGPLLAVSIPTGTSSSTSITVTTKRTDWRGCMSTALFPRTRLTIATGLETTIAGVICAPLHAERICRTGGATCLVHRHQVLIDGRRT